MGTRARINVFDGNEILVSIYRQFDGYPSGLGADVAELASGMKVVNGFSSDEQSKQANGIGCFAAQLIAKLKDRVGNVYLRNTGPDSQGEEFVYNVSDRGGRIWISVFSGSVTMFGCPGDKEAEMAAIWSGFADDFQGDAVEEAA